MREDPRPALVLECVRDIGVSTALALISSRSEFSLELRGSCPLSVPDGTNSLNSSRIEVVKTSLLIRRADSRNKEVTLLQLDGTTGKSKKRVKEVVIEKKHVYTYRACQVLLVYLSRGYVRSAAFCMVAS